MGKLITEYSRKKVADYLRLPPAPWKTCLIFWHGLGDLVMFLPAYEQLCSLFHDITIDIAIQGGTGQDELIENVQLSSKMVIITNPNAALSGYDYSFQIHFPMCEQFKGLYTKSAYCCQQELGIEPVERLARLKHERSPLVLVNFQTTALPGMMNASQETAQQIWKEILEAGLIPMEMAFVHSYYNPQNVKFDFVNCHVRDVKPNVKTLIGLLQSCFASISVATGNLPLSIAIMPDRTLDLEKAAAINCYTKEMVDSVNIENYKEGSVSEWLKKIKGQ